MQKKNDLLSVVSNAQIERRMELVRVVSHNTHKRMVSCLQGHVGADAEKRHVRLQTCYSETLNKAPLYPLKMKLNSVRTRPSVYDLSFVFSTPPLLPPHHPKNAQQSVPRLYTGNGQVKTLITYSASLVLGTSSSVSHSDICCLYSPCMTPLPLGFSL